MTITGILSSSGLLLLGIYIFRQNRTLCVCVMEAWTALLIAFVVSWISYLNGLDPTSHAIWYAVFAVPSAIWTFKRMARSWRSWAFSGIFIGNAALNFMPLWVTEVAFGIAPHDLPYLLQIYLLFTMCEENPDRVIADIDRFREANKSGGQVLRLIHERRTDGSYAG